MPIASRLSSRVKRSPSRRESRVPSVEELTKTLHEAAFQGDRKKVKKMLIYGLNVDYQDEKGQTALYIACMEGHEGLTELLLRHGANPNQRTLDGDTPIHSAANSGNARILSMLVEAGGDLRLHNRRGFTARDWAWKLADAKKRKNVLDLIEKRRSTALSQSGADILNSSFQSHIGSKSLTALKRQRHKSLIGSTSLHSDGFGQICIEKGTSVGAVATVPLVQEGSIRHDPYGYTYDNGPFMVMESMLWNKEPVTSKRLHKEAREGGHVDLLISELGYMSRLSHPSILLLMGTCRINNLEGLVLIYERVGLGSLFCCFYQKMETFSRLSTAIILQQTANALLYLHRQNLIHCYVSSHSIQLIRPDFAKLSNFEYMVESGSRMYSSILENKYLNAAYNWLAPEVLAGLQPTKKCDLYGLCAVLWEFVNGQVPWHNVPADTIVQELVERGHLLELGDHVEDPFNIMLEYGLSGQPDERRLSLEQMRDHLSEYIADCERLRKTDQLAGSVSAPSDRRDPRHAHFSPDVEIVSTSSGEGVALSTDDIVDALENLAPEPRPRLGISTSGVAPSDNAPNLSAGTSVKSANVQEPLDLSGASDIGQGCQSPLKLHDRESSATDRSANEEETLLKTLGTRKPMSPIPEHQKLSFDFHHQPLQQSTPLLQHGTSSTKSVTPVDNHTRTSPGKSIMPADSHTRPQFSARSVEEEGNSVTGAKEPCFLVQSTDDAKESTSQVSFDFIQNPLKKAFFEGSCVSPPCQQSTVTSSSPRSLGSIVSPRTGTNHNNYTSVGQEVIADKTRTFKSELDQLRDFKTLSDDDPSALQLQKETEAFIKSPAVRSQPTKTKFMKHTYGYYTNNIYRPKDDAERQLAVQTLPASAGSKIASLRAAGGGLLKASASPTFGVSLKELKMAVNQKTNANSDTKAEQATTELESISFGSMVSHASGASGNTLLAGDCSEPSISSSDIKHHGVETAGRDSSESKKPVLCMPTTHQHLSYVTALRSTPNYSSGIFSAKSPISRKDIAVVEDKEERAMISSCLASMSNSKVAIRPFMQKSPLFTTQDKSPRPGSIFDHSGSFLGPKSRIFEVSVEPPASQMESEEQVVVRRIKPASHHEPCLLKPSSKILASPQPGATPEALPNSRNSSGYGTQLAIEKERLSLTLPSKATTPFKDKRLESLKNEMDAMHRFKSDSVLQNKVDAAGQHRSAPQTPISDGHELKQVEPAAEVSIKDLISSFQTRMEEHKRKQSILILKRTPNQGGDSLCVTSSGNKQQWSKMNISADSTTPVTMQALQCSMEGRPKIELGKLMSSSKTKVVAECMANGAVGENVSKEVSNMKSLAKPDKVTKDICISKLQLSLTSPAVAKIRLQSEENAGKEVTEMVNQAILNSHEQILNKFVHQECPHKSTDITSLRAALGVNEAGLDKNDENAGGSELAVASATKLSLRSGGSDGSGPSSATFTVLPRFRSIAINTNRKDHQERATQKSQVSPTESASSRISSTDIKEFYYDDELNSPQLAMEKHLRLQSTTDFDSSENILTTSTLPRPCPSFNFMAGECSGIDSRDGQIGMSDSKPEKLAKTLLVTGHDDGTDTRTRGLSANGTESGHDTEDTDSTISSITEALCVTKHINTSRNEGYSSSVTVESHAKGYHTITCNKMDPLTGSQSTTYRAKVRAPRVITKFILDDDDHE